MKHAGFVGFVLIWSAMVFAQPRVQWPPTEAHPRLLVTRAQVLEIQRRVKQEKWAAGIVDALKQSLEPDLGREVRLPPRAGNWPHFYVCPKHGASLKKGKQTGEWSWEHLCSIDSEVFVADTSKASTDYDAMLYINRHSDNARNVLYAGLLYQITERPQYAEFVRAMALAYAAKAAEYGADKVRHDSKLPGLIQWASLDQAVWQVPMVQGIDCVWSTLSADERTTIAQQLLMPGVGVLKPVRKGIGNHDTWRNGAIGLTGYLLDDRELVEFAIVPFAGYHSQLEKGVSPDGQWFEGSWGYHNYTMNSVWPLALAATNCGTNLFTPQFKKMFDGPLEHAMPNMALPMFNDTWPDGVSRGLYPMAYAVWHDDRYLDAMPDPTVNRHPNVHALVFGLPSAAEQHKAGVERRGEVLSAGYTILRKGMGSNATWLSLKHAPHGGGHGHPDKNHFILYAGGEVLMPDFGSINYASILHREWARSTLAHNTLVVDGKSQQFTTGKSLAFADGLAGGNLQYASADAGAIYPEIRFVRTVALIGDKLLVGVDRVTADKAHDLEVAMSHFGQYVESPKGEAYVPPKNAEAAYRHLKHPVTVSGATEARQIAVKSPTGRTSTFIFPPSPGLQITLTAGPDREARGEVPLIILGKREQETTFVWAIDLGDGTTSVEAKSDGAITRIATRVGNRPYSIRVDSAAGNLAVE